MNCFFVSNILVWKILIDSKKWGQFKNSIKVYIYIYLYVPVYLCMQYILGTYTGFISRIKQVAVSAQHQNNVTIGTHPRPIKKNYKWKQIISSNSSLNCNWRSEYFKIQIIAIVKINFLLWILILLKTASVPQSSHSCYINANLLQKLYTYQIFWKIFNQNPKLKNYK